MSFYVWLRKNVTDILFVKVFFIDYKLVNIFGRKNIFRFDFKNIIFLSEEMSYRVDGSTYNDKICCWRYWILFMSMKMSWLSVFSPPKNNVRKYVCDECIRTTQFHPFYMWICIKFINITIIIWIIETK